MNLKIISNYSPNFNPKKRNKSQIKFLIFHYTGMKKESDAIKKLTNLRSNVSCHYFIKKKGEILVMVPDLYVSWHAGKSQWKSFKSLNKYSIGIEISNPGHDFKYKKFSKNQIESIKTLSKFLIKKYNIKKNFILGHSDIAPTRKKDPGEKFPWEYLSKKKVGYWHKIKKNNLIKDRNKKIKESEKKMFFQNLYKIGYSKLNQKLNNRHYKLLTKAFQRRFRQELINGVVDKECLKVSKSLIK